VPKRWQRPDGLRLGMTTEKVKLSMNLSSQSAAGATGDAESKASLVFSIVVVVGALLFVGSLFGLVLVNGAINNRTHAQYDFIQLATRQSALVERMDRDLVLLRVRNEPTANAVDLKRTADLFDRTAHAFASGGTSDNLSGNTSVKIDRLADPAALAMQNAVLAQWTPIYRAIVDVSRTPADGAKVARTSAAFGAKFGGLSVELRSIADTLRSSEAGFATLTMLRTLLIAFAIFCFALIVASLFIRFNESQRKISRYAEDLESRNGTLALNAIELAEAKRGTDLIMETVNQGLLLVDSQYMIAPQYSRELETIFRLTDLSSFSFLNVMQRMLTERMFNTTKDYLVLLFDRRRKERTLIQINPLDEVEVNFSNPEGGFITKYLGFTFRRIVENGEISRIFIAVADVTERVTLEKQLRDSELKKEKQFDMLLGILHVEPSMLDDFIATAKEQSRSMNDALRAQDFAASASMDQLRKKLDVVFRAVHNIKGNAALLKLDYFKRMADVFETKIVDLKNRSAIGGDDFLSIVILQSELRTDLDELQELRSKFANVSLQAFRAANSASNGNGNGGTNGNGAARPSADTVGAVSIAVAEAPRDADDLIESIGKLASSIGEKHGKQVRVDGKGFDSRVLPTDRRRMIKDVLIQLVRNSMTHGVEEADARAKLGKPRTATISVRRLGSTASNVFGFTYRDDGRGLDPDRIRARAVAQGIVTEDEAREYDDSGVVALIFAPGFSTTATADEDSGRGMGMDIIKQRIIDDCGGEISINSDPGKFCEFSFVIPIPELATS